MQPGDSQVNIVETKTVESAEWLRTKPVELTDIPDNTWVMLSVDQKKETLRQRPGLFEKYVGNVESAPAFGVENVVPANEVTPGVLVEQEQREQKNPEFEKALAQFKEVSEKSEEDKNPPVLTKEEISRIDEETAKSASIKTYKFFGYQPSQTTVTNAKQISDDAPVTDAKTWAATMIAKIFGIFQ